MNHFTTLIYTINVAVAIRLNSLTNTDIFTTTLLHECGYVFCSSRYVTRWIGRIPIQRDKFPVHIAFCNSGQLLENCITDRLFESHPSAPYSPIIANAVFRSGDIESWGRSYKRILEAVSAYKLLPPKLEMLSGLMITYYTDVRSQLLAQWVNERYISVVEYAAKNESVTFHK